MLLLLLFPVKEDLTLIDVRQVPSAIQLLLLFFPLNNQVSYQRFYTKMISYSQDFMKGFERQIVIKTF